MRPNIAVDMNIEVGTDAALKEIQEFFNKGYDAHLLLIGDQKKIESSEHFNGLEAKVEIIHAPETVESPKEGEDLYRYSINLIKRFKYDLERSQDSLSQGLLALNQDRADVFDSNAATGPFGTIARVTHLHPNIKKPPACCSYPSRSGKFPDVKFKDIAVCDVGTFLDPSKEDLAINYLLLRKELMSRGNPEPIIALLNIGEEKSKGGFYEQVHDFFKRIELPGFYGNGEPNHIFYNQEVDGYICDAFPGNIALKTAQGMHMFDMDNLQDSCKELVYKGELDVQTAKNIVMGCVNRTDLRNRKWAKILGSEKKLVLGHGNSGPLSLLQMSVRYAQEDIDVQGTKDLIEEYKDRIYLK